MKAIPGNELIKYMALLALLSVASSCRAISSQTLSDAMWENGIAKPVARSSPAVPRDPELPRFTLDTTYVPPARTPKLVAAGANLQAAIDAAQPGDVLALQAGATFTGNFTLPAKAGTDWIIIRSAASDSSLPQPGSRITPAFANSMPKIVSANNRPALKASSGAHHYRFIGVEFTVAPGVERNYNLIVLGDDETSVKQLPHDLIFDRVYIHGNQAVTLRRGIALNSASTAVIDSYISDCHEAGTDSQAIAGWNGPGPFKIVNNYLEGAGENFMLGGATPAIKNLVPSDVEFRNNHCFKPTSWKVGEQNYGGKHWTIKNLFELKNAQRVLIDGNLFENNWAEAQAGFAILFTVRTEDGEAPWAVVNDVTFSNNIVRHSGSGLNLSGRDDLGTPGDTRRIKIVNNLFEDINGPRWGDAAGRWMQIINGPDDVTIEHNTALQSGHLAIADGEPPSNGLVFQNNIAPNNEYGFFGSGTGTGTASLNRYFPRAIFRKNVVIGGEKSSYPSDNFFPESIEAVAFADRAAGNYRLSSSSPYRRAGTDGKDIGVDVDRLNAAFDGLINARNTSK